MPKKFETSITKANDKIARLKGRNTRLSKDVKSAPMGDALKNFAAIQAGAAGAGAAKATMGDELMGVPLEPMGGGLVALAGYFMDSPFMIYAAAGFIAPYVSELTEEMMEK